MNSGFNKYDLWQVARPRLGLIAVMAIVGLLVTFGATFLMTPVYHAHVTLLPVAYQSDPSRALGLAGAFGDLASLAGFTRGSSTKVEALETLKSRAFVRKFIVDQAIVDVLLSESELEELESVPSAERIAIKNQRATRKFLDRVVDITEDKRTGVVRLSVYWKDAGLAAQWANNMAEKVNVVMREAAQVDVRLRLEHLQAEASTSSIKGVQEAIYKVMESDIKSLAIASAVKEFAFKVVDPATAPESGDFVRPNRPALALVGFVLTIFICLVVLSMQYRSRAGGES